MLARSTVQMIFAKIRVTVADNAPYYITRVISYRGLNKCTVIQKPLREEERRGEDELPSYDQHYCKLPFTTESH